jgi:hypothetical protein
MWHAVCSLSYTEKNKLKYSSALKSHFSLLYVIDLRRYLNLKCQNDFNETLYNAQGMLYAVWYLVTAFCVDEASHSSYPVGAGERKLLSFSARRSLKTAKWQA